MTLDMQVSNAKGATRSTTNAHICRPEINLNSLRVEWDVAINIHKWSRYVTVISRDIRMYLGRFVGPSCTVIHVPLCLYQKATCESNMYTHTLTHTLIHCSTE